MTKTDGRILEFEEQAAPHSWLLVSSELHDQANSMYHKRGSEILTKRNAHGHVIEQIDPANRAAFLLAGFAIENVLKAFLIYENPNWISDGRLDRNLQSHSLTKLAQKSRLLPWKKRGVVVLEAFQDGLTSWARYPCPMYADQMRRPLFFTTELWTAYNQQMKRYYQELEKLLSKNWEGPHKFCGSYTFE